MNKHHHSEQLAAADYVAAFTTELADLARRHGLNTLGYILEMAKLEAENLGRQGRGLQS